MAGQVTQWAPSMDLHPRAESGSLRGFLVMAPLTAGEFGLSSGDKKLLLERFFARVVDSVKHICAPISW